MPTKYFLTLVLTSLLMGGSFYTLAQKEKIEGEDRLSVFKNYPVPHEKDMIFYIQKSFNTNTVVYAANFGADGKLDPKEPVKVYWIRYQEGGERKELKYIEQKFGYGVNSKPLKEKPNSYLFTLVSLKKMHFVITQDKNGEVKVATTINKKPAHIDRVFVTAEHVSLLPKIFSVEVFGRELKSHKFVYEKFIHNEK
ncbi:MAG: DUF4833 domain-containing protein [Vicingus serpentipes]|nr:DUF4833 domain-containing protein [Vicingus serpentipes]